MARAYYFSVRAIEVFISAVKYRHGEQLYYFAINWLSDASPEELDKMENKVMEKEASADGGQFTATLVSTAEPIDPGADIEADLRQLVGKHEDEPAFRELGEFLDTASELKRRHKRAVSSKKLRHLPNEKLINTVSDVELDPGVRAKMTKRVASNNPAYKPIELSSNGLIDEQKGIDSYYREKPVLGEVRMHGILYRLNDLFTDDGRFKSDHSRITSGAHDDDDDCGDCEEFYDAKDHLLPDEVFLDLRKTTECFLPPRNQRQCGSCYAFATTAIAEWLYCMQTSQLVEFSEQYMIDCGKEYVEGLDGCSGGNRFSSAKFLHNFGLELRDYYPYQARENKCPYYEDEPLNTTGFIRTDMPKMFEVSLREIPHLLYFGPMYAAIKTDKTFYAYGGGVHAIPCPDNQNGTRHAVVLVGHGRENGREYWLIRNSYGAGWGEQGYYKLDKSVGGICNHRAYAYATGDGFGSDMHARVNHDNPIERLRKPKTTPKPAKKEKKDREGKKDRKDKRDKKEKKDKKDKKRKRDKKDSRDKREKKKGKKDKLEELPSTPKIVTENYNVSPFDSP